MRSIEMGDSVETLKAWAASKLLGNASLSEDGTSLTYQDKKLPATETVTVSHSGKSCEYSLASIFLQILDPSQGLMPYRRTCDKFKVKDPVKPVDKKTVVSFFLGDVEDGASAPATTTEASKPAEPPTRPSPSKEHKKKHSRRKDGHKHAHARPPSSPSKKKRKAEITTEQLFSNLNVVVGKRDQSSSNEENAIHKALSAEGFSVTPEMLEAYKESTQILMSHEIPVGDSASILRAAAGRDLTRVLELYNETVSGSKHRAIASSPALKRKKLYLVGKKPVIVLPKGMTPPLTMINAADFFANAQFVPRDRKMKQLGRAARPPSSAVFSRKVGARFGGGTVEYELMDNPKSKLGENPQEWERIVAVVSLGASWQFKDWPPGYNDPVQLFGKTFGFFVGMENVPLPKELTGWAVLKERLNRDKRGLDSVCYASFWNGLDEWMAVHKPELLPQKED